MVQFPESVPFLRTPARLPYLGALIDTARNGLLGLYRSLAPAHLNLLDLASVGTVQAIYVAAKLGVADALAEGPATADHIAATVGADRDATFRLLRALAGRGIFRERPDGRFQLTPMAEALRSDTPNSVRALILLACHPYEWEHWGWLLPAVTTGEPMVEKLRGMPVFEFIEQNPGYSEVFNQAMTSATEVAVPSILAAYDFSRFPTVVDVGGGHGRMLAEILRIAPRSRGVLFDREHVTPGATRTLTAAGVLDRCTIESGSFFDRVPQGGDAYLLKHVIHDWPEHDARKILDTVRGAMSSAAVLISVEMLIPDGNRPHLSKLIDLDLLLESGGRLRTVQQYTDLLTDTGFRVRRIVPTSGPASVIEAVPA
ncbi:methyltransferase [Nocardia ninae]|uniref:Hydroxyneurosporene-O-methyltransferase n=1 Tax=Nocardia ninae NBRC 108245 TaxID=1210091 RepID=A0A511MI73_9NOCA|nr:methyltransferase [Nocardia ninae]GEM39798.1 hydroxyneurosporene-O-methyltransferase [Nocardia ninae NBRC 108245]